MGKGFIKKPKEMQERYYKFVEDVKANFDNEDAVLLKNEPNAIRVVKWIVEHENLDIPAACYIYCFCDFGKTFYTCKGNQYFSKTSFKHLTGRSFCVIIEPQSEVNYEKT